MKKPLMITVFLVLSLALASFSVSAGTLLFEEQCNVPMSGFQNYQGFDAGVAPTALISANATTNRCNLAVVASGCTGSCWANIITQDSFVVDPFFGITVNTSLQLDSQVTGSPRHTMMFFNNTGARETILQNNTGVFGENLRGEARRDSIYLIEVMNTGAYSLQSVVGNVDTNLFTGSLPLGVEVNTNLWFNGSHAVLTVNGSEVYSGTHTATALGTSYFGMQNIRNGDTSAFQSFDNLQIFNGTSIDPPPVIPLTVCIEETGVCYDNVDICSAGAISGQTCVIIDGGTYTVTSVIPTVALTFKTNSTTGQPTVIGTSVGNPVFDLATSATGIYTIDGLRIVHSDGMGVAVDGTVTQATITNNIFEVNASTGNNFGDGGANGVWLAQGDNHIIQNNTVNTNGGVCCNYGVHVDGGWNALAIDNVLIDNNNIFVSGSGEFDNGITVYENFPTPHVNLIISENTIVVDESASDGFGIYLDSSSVNTRNNVITVTSAGIGVGVGFNAALTAHGTMSMIGDTITVNGGTFVTPITGTFVDNATIVNVTLVNSLGTADIGFGSGSNTICPADTFVVLDNLIWSENVTLFGGGLGVGAGGASNTICGEVHVRYDVTAQTGVSGATVTFNSQNPDAHNPTNSEIGIADGAGDFTLSVGAFFADNETYQQSPYLSFNPYDVTATATGYDLVADTISPVTSNNVLSMLLTLLPPVEPEIPLRTPLRLVLGLAMILIIMGAIGFGVKKK